MPVGRTVKVALTRQSVSSAIRQVEAYKREVKRKVQLLVAQVVADGVELVKAKIVQMDAVMFGDLLNSITGVYDPSTGVGVIVADCPYAVYVEFGTGIRGAQNPHPDVQGWRYDVNSHGEAGWWYWSDADSNWHWTRGMPSRPFMWETAQELGAVLKVAAKAVFR